MSTPSHAFDVLEIQTRGSRRTSDERRVDDRRPRHLEPVEDSSQEVAPLAPSAMSVPDGRLLLLSSVPVESLDTYRLRGGLLGLQAARAMDPEQIVATVEASGLQGRGGAGFPAGRKWATVAGNAVTGAATVVVNGAEGEPGTFKDRTILRHNPYQVLEGALIAARAVHAERVVIALKASFTEEIDRTSRALAEMRAANAVCAEVACSIFLGPDEYLYGEESALLECIDGRGPFPRVVPPYRVGLLGEDRWRQGTVGPALVNNLETIANIPNILAHGVTWFRSVGTPNSPGTVACTVTGDVRRAGVAEVPMGTKLRTVIESIGGGPQFGKTIKAVLSGVANPIITADDLDVPVSHDGMASIGCGLGSAGFIVFDQGADMVAAAAGVARFLAIESCGQCTPCKADGFALATLLARLARSRASRADLMEIEDRIARVDFGARCYLGSQQQTVLDSILNRFRAEFHGHADGKLSPAEPVLVAELVDIRDNIPVVDERHRRKQPDWSYRATSSGSTPVELRSRRSHTGIADKRSDHHPR